MLKKLAVSVLEGILYGSFGAIFVLIVLLIEDFLTKAPPIPGMSLGMGERGIPPGGVFLAGILSVVLWNFLFAKIIKTFSIRWFLILATTSITALLMQTAFLIHSQSDWTMSRVISTYLPDGISDLIGMSLMIELFIIIAPFTVLFANRQLIIEKIKIRNALK